MSEQESILYCSWRITWLEQEIEKLWQEYVDKVAAINSEIEKLQSKISNATIITSKAVKRDA